ncbi:WD40-repeat-containing domain protein [Pilobolus umbonatus]|nr:WD40-repeat-containing domain protein [Pilobolus umbonatus]
MKLSEYEKKQRENIEKNMELLRKLDIPIVDHKRKQEESKEAKRAHRKRMKETPTPTQTPTPMRTSSRIKGVKADMSNIMDDPEVLITGTKVREYTVEREESLDKGQQEKIKALFENTLQNVPNVVTDRVADPPNSTEEEYKEVLSKLEIQHQWKTVKMLPYRAVKCLFHPSATKILACGADVEGNIGFWDVNAEEDEEPVVYNYRPHKRFITDMMYSPVDHTKLFTASYDSTIRIYDMNTTTFNTLDMANVGYNFTSFDFSDNGQVIWFATSDGEIGMKDMRTTLEADIYQSTDKKVGCIHVNPVHTHLLTTASNDRHCYIHDIRSWKKSKDTWDPIERIEHGFAVTSAYWSPNGSKLVTTSYDSYIRLFNYDQSQLKLKVSLPHNTRTGRWVTGLRARWNTNPNVNLEHFIIGNMEHSVDIYSGETGNEIGSLYDPAHITAVPSCAIFHPSTPNPAILTANGSGRVVYWA